MRSTLPALITALALALPMVASAQVYKWVDASGTTHFSETPPPQGVKYQNIRTPSTADQGAPQPASDAASSGADAGKAKAADKRSPQLQRFCSQLESNISLLKSSQPLQRMGSDGKNVPMDNSVRAQQLKQQQQRYDAFCTGQ